ncbi:MAG: cobalamin biosynthesis protein [Anaerolineaceae bacterium]|nr:cobalamin biosynthesis protein [Anaerolineaceae bacterium]
MTTRLIIIGGFLGAGKTTLLLKSARLLTGQGYRVGLVTNDQGKDLVDTLLLSQQNFPVSEVSGSCFCCAFPDLLQALRQLMDSVQPDVILAEPVGSCTDLTATVLRPLAEYYPAQFEVAPLTVLVDAARELDQFSANVSYLFDRQLAEAEFILLNKADLLADDLWTRQAALQSQYSHARLLSVSAHTGQGVDQWLETVLGQTSSSAFTMTVDYDRYAEAEAELAWLNAKGIVRSSTPFSARHWTANLLTALEQALAGSQIAHIKTHVSTLSANFKASITQHGFPAAWDVDSEDIPTDQLEFVLNARVSTDPNTLQQMALQSIDAVKPDPLARYYLTHFECFRPLPPRPTYRLPALTQQN